MGKERVFNHSEAVLQARCKRSCAVGKTGGAARRLDDACGMAVQQMLDDAEALLQACREWCCAVGSPAPQEAQTAISGLG